MARRRVKRFLWAFALTALLVFGLRTFVGDVYRVASSSMEPALYPDERVFLRYDRSMPARGELVVVRDGSESMVKRVVGLPGESVRVEPSGDVYIDGAPLSLEDKPEPVLVFDDRRQPISENFQHGGTAGDPWTERDGAWELDGREVARGSALGLMRYCPRLLDGRFGRDGRFIPGLFPVHDAAVELELQALESGGVARLQLVEQGDIFELAVELEDPDGDGVVDAVLTRTTAAGSEELARTGVPFRDKHWTRVRFENLDNQLRVFWDGAPVLYASYAANSFQAADIFEQGKSYGHRVLFGGEECHLLVRGVRIARDLHYTRRAPTGYGVDRPCELHADEIYVLGDNSAASLDSRERGPFPLSSIVGRPLWVVWPPSAIRRL